MALNLFGRRNPSRSVPPDDPNQPTYGGFPDPGITYGGFPPPVGGPPTYGGFPGGGATNGVFPGGGITYGAFPPAPGGVANHSGPVAFNDTTALDNPVSSSPAASPSTASLATHVRVTDLGSSSSGLAYAATPDPGISYGGFPPPVGGPPTYGGFPGGGATYGGFPGGGATYGGFPPTSGGFTPASGSISHHNIPIAFNDSKAPEGPGVSSGAPLQPIPQDNTGQMSSATSQFNTANHKADDLMPGTAAPAPTHTASQNPGAPLIENGRVGFSGTGDSQSMVPKMVPIESNAGHLALGRDAPASEEIGPNAAAWNNPTPTPSPVATSNTSAPSLAETEFPSTANGLSTASSGPAFVDTNAGKRPDVSPQNSIVSFDPSSSAQVRAHHVDNDIGL